MQTNRPAKLFRLFPSSQVLLPHRVTQRSRERKAQGGGRFKGRYLFNKSLHYSHTDADSKRAKPTTHRQATPTPREFRRGPRRHMTPLRPSINSRRRRGLEDFVVRRTLRAEAEVRITLIVFTRVFAVWSGWPATASVGALHYYYPHYGFFTPREIIAAQRARRNSNSVRQPSGRRCVVGEWPIYP